MGAGPWSAVHMTGGHNMIELDFCGYLSLSGSGLGECLDAAGSDACVAAHDHDCHIGDEPGDADVVDVHW
jgi:hypothetical protein